MTSEEARDMFSAAYDGELAADLQASFDQAMAADADLAADYGAFGETLEAAGQDLAGLDGNGPDLLAGVQNKLRTRSRGRFYGDRYAERRGRPKLTGPVGTSMVLIVLLGTLWVGMHYINMMQVYLDRL